MDVVRNFLIRKRGGSRLDWSDVITYLYLVAAVIVMFGPVLWVVVSSFKTDTQLLEFPPRFLPYAQKTVTVAGYDDPLPLFTTTLDGELRTLAQIRRVGLEVQLIDPDHPRRTRSVPRKGSAQDKKRPAEAR